MEPTIEERARKLACRGCDICKGEPQPCGGGQYQIYTNCLKIATEQREIDIQRAVEWYCNKCKHGKTCAMRYSQDACSKIKELKEVMKG